MASIQHSKELVLPPTTLAGLPHAFNRRMSSDIPTIPQNSEEQGASQPPLPPPPPSYHASRNEKSSLDITQKLERKLASLNASESVLRRWLFEIVSWAISALCMGAIIAILAYLDNKSLTKWPFGLTLNTVLSKVASAALILPTSEALGQLKWNWFHGNKSKEMWDFEIFDKASRGPWGSVLLLFRTKGRSLAALGAILTVLLIANDTFFQQVVALSKRWEVDDSSSSIAKVYRYDPGPVEEFRGNVPMTLQDLDVRPLVQTFFYQNGTQPIPFGNGTGAEFPVLCPSGNCTWPLYKTLGMCSSCVDASKLLTQGCLRASADWISNLTGIYGKADYPNGTMCGYFLNATSESPVMMSGYLTDRVESSEGIGLPNEALLVRTLPLITFPERKRLFGGSINFKNVRNPIIDFLIVSAANGSESVYRNETPVAHECVMSWCIKTVRSAYVSANYQEEIVDTFINTTAGPNPWITYRLNDSSVPATYMMYTENITFDASPSGRHFSSYGVDNVTTVRLANIFDEFLPSFWTITNATAKPALRYKVNIKGIPFTRRMKSHAWMAPNNVTHHMERLATAMTNRIRSSTSSTMVSGSAFSVDTCISVQWAWLTFPFALLILSLVFLVATMVKTSKRSDQLAQPGRMGVWKTSAMPALIYSLPSDLQKQFTSVATGPRKPQDGAKTLKLRLHPNKGWRVSGHQCSPDTPMIRTTFSRQPPPGWI